MEGRRLADLKLSDEGLTVLGIHLPDGSYLGVPRGETTIRAGDRLVLYGRDERSANWTGAGAGKPARGSIARPWPTTISSAGSCRVPTRTFCRMGPAPRRTRDPSPGSRAAAA